MKMKITKADYLQIVFWFVLLIVANLFYFNPGDKFSIVTTIMSLNLITVMTFLLIHLNLKQKNNKKKNIFYSLSWVFTIFNYMLIGLYIHLSMKYAVPGFTFIDSALPIFFTCCMIPTILLILIKIIPDIKNRKIGEIIFGFFVAAIVFWFIVQILIDVFKSWSKIS